MLFFVQNYKIPSSYIMQTKQSLRSKHFKEIGELTKRPICTLMTVDDSRLNYRKISGPSGSNPRSRISFVGADGAAWEGQLMPEGVVAYRSKMDLCDASDTQITSPSASRGSTSVGSKK